MSFNVKIAQNVQLRRFIKNVMQEWQDQSIYRPIRFYTVEQLD